MSKKTAFWTMWITTSCGITWFFYIIGVLDSIDLGKSVILTIILLLTAYPIKRFINSNTEFHND